MKKISLMILFTVFVIGAFYLLSLAILPPEDLRITKVEFEVTTTENGTLMFENPNAGKYIYTITEKNK